MDHLIFNKAQELKLAALDRAITHHSYLMDSGSADEILTTASKFESYLTSNQEVT